jgi:hypothetical protein
MLVFLTAISSILRPFCLFFGHVLYFTAIVSILRPFGTFCGHLVNLSLFGMLYREKSGNPGYRPELKKELLPPTARWLRGPTLSVSLESI